MVSFGILTLLFAMIYKIMPRANISWRDVWIGATVTACKVLIGLYMGKSSLTSGFGTAGSLVVLIHLGLLLLADFPVRRAIHLGVRPSAVSGRSSD